MQSERKTHIGNSIPRAVLVAISVLLQAGWLLLLILKLNASIPWIGSITRLLSVIVVLRVNSKQMNSAYKMAWIMLIIALPIMGVSLYALLWIFGDIGSMGKRRQAIRNQNRPYLKGSGSLSALETQEPAVAGLARYLQQHNDCPVYENTDVHYFAEAY